LLHQRDHRFSESLGFPGDSSESGVAFWQPICSLIRAQSPAVGGREGIMTGYLVLTETEPMIVVMPKGASVDGTSARRLADASGDRFVAFEVDISELHNQYGVPFEVVEADIRNGRDFRVLDAVGRRVFQRIRFSRLGRRIVPQC
jgi:hypothetical protein